MSFYRFKYMWPKNSTSAMIANGLRCCAQTTTTNPLSIASSVSSMQCRLHHHHHYNHHLHQQQQQQQQPAHRRLMRTESFIASAHHLHNISNNQVNIDRAESLSLSPFCSFSVWAMGSSEICMPSLSQPLSADQSFANALRWLPLWWPF